MLDDFFEIFREHRQDSQLRRLHQRLEMLSEVRRRAAPERHFAAAVVRLLLKKGLITADELADELEAVNEEQFAKVRDGFRLPGEPLDAERIAKLENSGQGSASETKPDE
jgi:hypothetical protein